MPEKRYLYFVKQAARGKHDGTVNELGCGVGLNRKSVCGAMTNTPVVKDN